MSALNYLESSLDPARAGLDYTVPAGEGWMHELRSGQTLRIVDLEGNQAVDTLFYAAGDAAERYSAQDTVREQDGIYLTTGSRLLSSARRTMLTIVADTVAGTIRWGGACSAESNQVRYALDKRPMHSCRDTFLQLIGRWGRGFTKRDLTHNINFFMNVPVTPEGGLSFADGVSAGGRYVEMRAAMDVVVLVSNCPQLNNPCNAYNPTPVQLLIWD